ncbi:MAG: DMT family transporter [Campylobacteraceae bacterium]
MPININYGVFWMLLASFCFAVMSVFVKILSSYLGVLEITFLRNIFGVLIIGFAIYKMPLKQKGGKMPLLFFRGFIGFVALLAWFYNIAHIPLADAITFSKTAPIFTAIIAYFLLKEKMSIFGWFAIFIGFVGIILIMKPNVEIGLKTTDIMGILSGVGAALAYTSVRELKQYYDTKAIVLSFMLVGTIGPLLMIGFNAIFLINGFEEFFGKPTMPHGIVWFYIIIMGIFATLAQIFLTKAYGATKAAIVATVSYADIIFAGIFSAIFWGVYPDLLALFGIMLVILSGILVAKEKI